MMENSVAQQTPATEILWHPLAEGIPPSWASGWGEDRYGVWVEITVEEVTQRLRWIAPGEFLMGSPEDEPGRFEDEGPQHRVTLSQGFWLFDTPCTQALWEAVMGENPSYFKSTTRPVENVSWDDCQVFLERLNSLIFDLCLCLPSEAQWEYACRAGTDTATYVGLLEILGGNNAPALDPIAWYGGNSGVDFELDNGRDMSEWKEKQYVFERAGTHPVGQKRPNVWGLYDMLGNVLEWCTDGRRAYQKAMVQDPLGPLKAGGKRVIRGGAWYDHARSLRCAFRDAVGPGHRFDALGLRCARVQS
jgi:formylglycine-generating enzyme required for sulfatase activity